MRLGPPHNTRELHGSNLSSQLQLPYLGYEHTHKAAQATQAWPNTLSLESEFSQPSKSWQPILIIILRRLILYTKLYKYKNQPSTLLYSWNDPEELSLGVGGVACLKNAYFRFYTTFPVSHNISQIVPQVHISVSRNF